MSLKVIREQKISIVVATPSFLMLYMRKGTGEDFKSLRLAITGAERLREDIAEKFRRMTGLEITEGYGCTELSPVVSINVANSRMELGVEVAKPGSIGAPLPGICAKIVDPSTFELMPENTDGLMIVKDTFRPVSGSTGFVSSTKRRPGRATSSPLPCTAASRRPTDSRSRFRTNQVSAPSSSSPPPRSERPPVLT